MLYPWYKEVKKNMSCIVLYVDKFVGFCCLFRVEEKQLFDDTVVFFGTRTFWIACLIIFCLILFVIVSSINIFGAMGGQMRLVLGYEAWTDPAVCH